MNNASDRLKNAIRKYYRRNKSLADTLSKLSFCTDKTVRSVVKSATHCGCISFEAKKQPPELKGEVLSYIHGTLCKACREKIEQNAGQSIFYLYCLCEALSIIPEDLIESQAEQIEILGRFNLR